jgi:hypothetical protein
MSTYILFYFYFYFAALVQLFVRDKYLSKALYILSAILLVIFVGGRYKTGTDWESYYEYFNNNDFSWDLGWSYINGYFYKLGLRFELLLFLISSLSIYFKLSKLKVIGAESCLFIFLIFPFIVSKDFGVLRQGFAISICFFAFFFLIKERIASFILLIILASLFHQSAIIFFVALLLVRFRFTGRQLLFIIFLSFISYIFDITYKLLHDYLLYFQFDWSVINKVQRYLFYSDDYVENVFPYLSVLKKLIVLLVVFLFMGKRHRDDKYFNGAFNLYFFGVCIFIALGDFSQLRRLAGYFELFEYLVVCVLILTCKSYFEKIALLSFFFTVNILKLVTYVATYHAYLIPYRSIFDFIF